jgi:hypothetical protein
MQEIQLTFDVHQLRRRLQKMTDNELREFGRTAAHMVSPKATMGQPPREAFVVQLGACNIPARYAVCTRVSP